MTTDKTGGPAFPLHDERNYLCEGMTLLDWYAGQALASCTSDSARLVSATHFAAQDGISSQAAIAQMAFDIADAMLAERKKRGIV